MSCGLQKQHEHYNCNCSCGQVSSTLKHAVHVVSAKRKRQEEFQSRKRQALNPATSPASAAIHTTTTITTPSSPQRAPAEQAKLAAEGSDATMMEASLTAAVPLNEQAVEEETAGGLVSPEDPGTTAPGNGLLAASSGQTPHHQVTATDGSAGSPPGRALHEANGDADGATTADMAQPVAQQGQQDVVTQAGGHTGKEKKMSSSALPSSQRCVVAKPVNDARGHTGYLTFARRSVDD